MRLIGKQSRGTASTLDLDRNAAALEQAKHHVERPRLAQEGSEPVRARQAELPARLLTVAEVAGWFGIHPKTISRLRKTAGLPCVRVGTALRFDATQVARWLDLRKGGQT